MDARVKDPSELSSSEFEAIQADFGYTNAEMAEALNCQERTIEDYRIEGRTIKGPVVQLLRTLHRAYRVCSPEQFSVLVKL